MSDTVKPVLSSYSKIDKTKVLMTNGGLMKIESIAECSLGAFSITLDLHSVIICLENECLVFFLSGHLRQVLLYKVRNLVLQCCARRAVKCDFLNVFPMIYLPK